MSFDIYVASPGLRFALGISGSCPLLVMGLNPSTATDSKFDLTLRKVSTIANRSGFDGYVMLNLCPIRSTAIANLPIDLPNRWQQQNLATICQIAGRCAPLTIWAAWGVGIQARSYFGDALREIVTSLRDSGDRWIRYDTLTNQGHPRHPSRVRYGASFHPFNVSEYAEGTKNIYKN